MSVKNLSEKSFRALTLARAKRTLKPYLGKTSHYRLIPLSKFTRAEVEAIVAMQASAQHEFLKENFGARYLP